MQATLEPVPLSEAFDSMLTQERRKRVAEALRSGEFRQGQDSLHRGETYCCLGVACEVYNELEGFPEVWGEEDFQGDREFMGDDTNFVGKLRDYFGIDSEQEELFINMNDSAGFSFEEIADYWEDLEKLEGYDQK